MPRAGLDSPLPSKQSALLLRLSPLGESDILIDLFTAGLGRTAAVAKGGKRSQKRFFGLLLWGHLLQVDLLPMKRSQDLFMLEAASLAEPFTGLRLDHRRLMAAGPVMELLLRATAPFDPHPRALALAALTLARLEMARSASSMSSALVIFMLRLLRELGFGLSLDACLACGCPPPQSGDPCLSLGGGLVCPACAAGGGRRGVVQVPRGLVRGLAAALELEGPALGRLSFPPAQARVGLGFLGRFWQQVAGHDLPSLGAAARCLGGPA